jgi:hypothetical protein
MSGKSLKQFLQDKPGCEYWFAVLNALDESHDVRSGRAPVTDSRKNWYPHQNSAHYKSGL